MKYVCTGCEDEILADVDLHELNHEGCPGNGILYNFNSLPFDSLDEELYTPQFPPNIPTDRVERGLYLAQNGFVKEIGTGLWLVQSQTDATKTYKVNQTDWAAHNCPDADKNEVCKHMWATFGVHHASFIARHRRGLVTPEDEQFLTEVNTEGFPVGLIKMVEAEKKSTKVMAAYHKVNPVFLTDTVIL